MRSIILAACTAMTMAVLPAWAANPLPKTFDNGITRAELLRVLASHGVTVRDATQNEADPWLKARSPKGTDFAVNMYDCSGGGAGKGTTAAPAAKPEERRCNNLQFLTQWELSSHTTQAAASAYNQRYVFGRAYMSADGRTFMFDYSVNIKDGVTQANLKRQVDNWLRVLDDVRAMLKV